MIPTTHLHARKALAYLQLTAVFILTRSAPTTVAMIPRLSDMLILVTKDALIGSNFTCAKVWIRLVQLEVQPTNRYVSTMETTMVQLPSS